MMVVDGVVVVIVVKHEPLYQLVDVFLEVLLDRSASANCSKTEEKAKAGLSHL